MAFTVVDGLTWNKSYRTRIENALCSTYPQQLAVVKELAMRISRACYGGKKTARNSALQTLDYFNRWYSKQTGQNQSFRNRIGISPLFTKQQMGFPANQLITIFSENPRYYGQQLRNVCIVNKSDGTRFRTICCPDALTQHEVY